MVLKKYLEIIVTILSIVSGLTSCSNSSTISSPLDSQGSNELPKVELEHGSEEPRDWYDNLEDALIEPNSVKYLTLREQGFEVFPQEILHLPNLIELDITMNLFSEFPNEIAHLGKLSYLSSSYGRLETLPDSIGKLKNLVTLILIDNDISHLPESIGGLESLETLNLNGNPIRKIPDSLFKLQKLKRLTLVTMGEKSLFSKEEQERIRANMPNCRISFER